MDNPEKLATYVTEDEDNQYKKTSQHKKRQHNMCWTPPGANKHK